MQTNLAHLDGNKFVQMAFVTFPKNMLFVIDLSTKMSGTSLLKNLSNDFFLITQFGGKLRNLS